MSSPQYFRRLTSSTEAECKVPEDRHDDRQTDHDLGRCHHHHEEGTDLAVEISVLSRANVTSVRLQALSISSTHMKTTIALRRTRTPTAPIEKSTEASQDEIGSGAHRRPAPSSRLVVIAVGGSGVTSVALDSALVLGLHTLDVASRCHVPAITREIDSSDGGTVGQQRRGVDRVVPGEMPGLGSGPGCTPLSP